jgi:MFS family permease
VSHRSGSWSTICCKTRTVCLPTGGEATPTPVQVLDTLQPGRALSHNPLLRRTSGYLAVVIAGSLAGYSISAHLADWLGRKTTLILFTVGSLATVVGYTHSPDWQS